MKKYALIIAASGLLCMLQVQSAEKSLRTFKYEVLQDIEESADSAHFYHPGFGFNSGHAMTIAFNAKRLAIAQGIPLNEAASMVIALLTQETSADLQKWGVTNQQIRQEVWNAIREVVHRQFGAR